jgi:membrane protease YdiL (CAAX protease family)
MIDGSSGEIAEDSGRPAAADRSRRASRLRGAGESSSRGPTSDPVFGFMIAAALSIGLTPLLPDNADLRYTLAWGTLSGVSVLTWLLGHMERIGSERPENIGWGVLYGLMLGIPLMVVLRQAILEPAAAEMFPNMSLGSLLAFLVFVMPMSETLFFRGLLQRQLPFWIVGILATLWNLVLFFPVMWQTVTQLPAITLVLVIVLFLMNMTFVYVRERNGLAASWMCQIVANLIVLYIPFL